MTRHEYARDYLANQPVDRRCIVWVDEVGFNLHLRRRQGRAMRGQHASVTVPNNRGRNISIAAAMSEDGFIHHRVQVGAYNAMLFIDFLGELFVKLRENERYGCWIVLDNVRFHHTEAVLVFVQANGHTLRFLPAYSPMLNPIESLFSKWKSLIKTEHVPYNQQELLTNIRRGVQAISIQDCLGWIHDTTRNLSLCLLNQPFD
jgi:transposase